jgi:hypothetical protein
MDRLLNKVSLLFIAAFAFSDFSVAQEVTGEPERNSKDYKDPEQHERFNKRRNIVGAWQINELKNGALVVRLKTNHLAIEELRKAGNTKLADEKEIETFAINKNTMFAFLDNFRFCKVYFMPAQYSDSLLAGKRSGIFLDTNLNINPAITLKEKFYLLAERDYAYNSSIGFVPEDSARKVFEGGNPVKQMAVVIKNKYGHQLKGPFPYFVKEKTFADAAYYTYPVSVRPTGGPLMITYQIDRSRVDDFEKGTEKKRMPIAPGSLTVKIPKQFTYDKLSEAVQELNNDLETYHRKSPSPQNAKGYNDAVAFFY